jgi:uncharacterized protein YegJ (DUF2314 family)
LAATVLLFVCPVAVGQTTLDKAKNDELAFVPKNDPAMARAFDKARATLDQFLRLLRDAPLQVQSPAVKVGIADGDQTEFFWIAKLEQNGERFSGLITNQPRLVKTVRTGQRYEFARSQIVDWMYVDARSNKMMGNYTACALLTREPPDQAAAFKRQYGLDCDV